MLLDESRKVQSHVPSGGCSDEIHMHSQVYLQSCLLTRELMEVLGRMQAILKPWLLVYTCYAILRPEGYMHGGQSFT